MQTKVKSSKFLIALTVVISFKVFVATGIFWLARGGLTTAKINILKSGPFILSSLEGKPLMFKDYWKFYELYKTNTDVNKSINYQEIFNLYLENQKTIAVANKLKIQINKKDALEFSNYIKQASLTNSDVSPEVILNFYYEYKLQIWYNSQPSLNQKEYALLESLKNRLSLNEDFAKLASDYSLDEPSKNFGGDLGFVEVPILLPELREPILNLKPGDYKIIPSNLGVHLFLLDKNIAGDNNTKHLRQIYLKTYGFEEWLKKQKSEIAAKQYITL